MSEGLQILLLDILFERLHQNKKELSFTIFDG